MSSSVTFSTIPVIAKVAILLVIVAVIGAFYYFVLHLPLKGEISAKEGEHQTLQGRLAAANEKEQQFAVLTAELAERETIDRRNRRILPADPEIAAFVQDIHRLGEQSGVDIRNIDPQEQEPAALYVRVPVRVQVKGRYHEVARFFWSVSQLDRAINMENIQLGEPTETVEEVELSVDALATTFRRLAEGEQGVPQGEEVVQ